ncbi:hypothetical protein Ga0466249_002780 [Sporomusaceae bacterium BoRhaA]|nr:hypothetical protein [Pelorhabdus rhamnosifermentans]MBU2701661.1 hypothetical protein [Pelorhabdus rhamnosifermentans]
MAKPLPEEIQTLYISQIKEPLEFSKIDIFSAGIVFTIIFLAFVSGGV